MSFNFKYDEFIEGDYFSDSVLLDLYNFYIGRANEYYLNGDYYLALKYLEKAVALKQEIEWDDTF